jgi:hypothetical protein
MSPKCVCGASVIPHGPLQLICQLFYDTNIPKIGQPCCETECDPFFYLVFGFAMQLFVCSRCVRVHNKKMVDSFEK